MVNIKLILLDSMVKLKLTKCNSIANQHINILIILIYI